jgi:hypothetical protein
MPFENSMGLTANFAAEVLDPNGILPVEIIQTTQAWSVRVQWNLSGLNAPFLQGAGRQWKLQVFAESIGTGFEGELTPAPIMVPVGPVAAAAPNFTYDVTIPITAAALSTPGVYKLVTVLTLVDGAAPLPIAAYQEGPVVQTYAPV